MDSRSCARVLIAIALALAGALGPAAPAPAGRPRADPPLPPLRLLRAPATAKLPLALGVGELRLNSQRGCAFLTTAGRKRLVALPHGSQVRDPGTGLAPTIRLPDGAILHARDLIAGAAAFSGPGIAERHGVRGARAEARRCGLARSEVSVFYAVDSVRPRGTFPLVVRVAGSPEPTSRLTGRIVLHEQLGCAWFMDRGVRRPAIWPSGTTWRPRRHAIQLPNGTLIRGGDRVSGRIGIEFPGKVVLEQPPTDYDPVPWRRRCLGVALIPPKQALIGGNVSVVVASTRRHRPGRANVRLRRSQAARRSRRRSAPAGSGS